jgi:Protein of unknown function (DUF1553)/Protein of unknown function (DUF1549)/Concanavalin A-like lectin/glucanases superfamily/Planctomycete cytochrome C
MILKPTAFAFALFAPVLAFGADAVSYNRDIRPILAEHCYHCHGPDPGSRKEGIRFDREEGFFGDRDGSGPTVVKGHPEKSPLIERITSTDPDEIMPPPKEKKPMKPADIALIQKWIAQGAQWQPHWAFIKPERPPVPNTGGNPIDSFVASKLAAAGLAPSPEADKASLARRVFFDLTGLPPTPEEVESFVNDASPDAYLKLVERLLASPSYGEHRARYWLDAARYADTHGLHFDNYREMWAYRDWVIAAFNANQPFDSFTVEQIAGDLLPNPTPAQRIATGFHRCNITTNEGGTIDAENLANYARDRVETTSWVWLGLTANCAVCHDHKFDPITQRDFYAMSAFFRNTTQSAKDGNVRNTGPVLFLPQGEDAARLAALPGEIEASNSKLEARRVAVRAEFDKWLPSVRPEDLQQRVSDGGLALHLPMNEGSGNEVKGIIDGKESKFTISGAVPWRPDGKAGPSPRLSEGISLNLGDVADLQHDKPFTIAAWVRPSSDGKSTGSVMARMDKNTAGHRGWDLHCQDGEYQLHLVNEWPKRAIKVRTNGKQAKPGEWRHILVTYDGSGKAAGVDFYINGKPAKTKAGNDNLKGSIHTGVPFRIGQREGSDYFAGNIQDVRIYSRALVAAEVRQLSMGPDVVALLARGAARSPEETAKLFEFYSGGDDELADLSSKVAALTDERKAIEGRSPVTHIQMERADTEPLAHLLNRGQYDEPREELKPAVIASLHPMPANAPANRLGLAQWLVSRENPLTSRVIVNRFWQELFGNGIVKTAEDLGIMGDTPSHPELLDWLAVEFIESGWNVKHLLKLMVTSATYRQSQLASKAAMERDPTNRLLSRGPRFRLDAEMIRDSALAAGGLLVRDIGGPSVKPYQPEGVWEAVAMPESNTRNYKRDKGADLYRRSLYTFWKRAAPPASMDIFNAPSRETSCVRRERTNTPLQALVVLNDPQFIEAQRSLAQLALKTAPNDAAATLDVIARRLLARTLKPAEATIILASLRTILTHYEQTPADAIALLSVGEMKPDPAIPPPRLAAWTMIANQIMNLDEALTK